MPLVLVLLEALGSLGEGPAGGDGAQRSWRLIPPVSGWGHTVGLSPGACGGALSPLQVPLFYVGWGGVSPAPYLVLDSFPGSGVSWGWSCVVWGRFSAGRVVR